MTLTFPRKGGRKAPIQMAYVRLVKLGVLAMTAVGSFR